VYIVVLRGIFINVPVGLDTIDGDVVEVMLGIEVKNIVQFCLYGTAFCGWYR
jgi:hypothetical protein